MIMIMIVIMIIIIPLFTLGSVYSTSASKAEHTLLRIPTGRVQSSWLLTSVAEDLNLGLPRNNYIKVVVRVGLEPGSGECESDKLTTRPRCLISSCLAGYLSWYHAKSSHYLIWLRYHVHWLNLGTLRWHIRCRLVSPWVFFTIKQGSIKLAWCADKEYHESTITYKTRFTLEEIFPDSSILEYSDS